MKYVFGQFELNPAMRELLRGGSPVALRPRSLECLIYLIEHRDRVVEAALGDGKKRVYESDIGMRAKLRRR